MKTVCLCGLDIEAVVPRPRGSGIDGLFSQKPNQLVGLDVALVLKLVALNVSGEMRQSK